MAIAATVTPAMHRKLSQHVSMKASPQVNTEFGMLMPEQGSRPERTL
jgi:hypothetical protein